MADTDTTEEQQQAEVEQPDTGDATGEEKGGESGQTFTQADVDRIVADRLKRESEKAEKKRQQEEADAEAKRLESEKKYQELAEQRANRIVELEKETARIADLEAQLESSNKALTAQLEALREGVPAHILELIAERDLPSQLDWLTKHRSEYVAGESARKGHVPATPKANAGGIPDEEKLKQATPTWRGI